MSDIKEKKPSLFAQKSLNWKINEQKQYAEAKYMQLCIPQLFPDHQRLIYTQRKRKNHKSSVRDNIMYFVTVDNKKFPHHLL